MAKRCLLFRCVVTCLVCFWVYLFWFVFGWLAGVCFLYLSFLMVLWFVFWVFGKVAIVLTCCFFFPSFWGMVCSCLFGFGRFRLRWGRAPPHLTLPFFGVFVFLVFVFLVCWLCFCCFCFVFVLLLECVWC